MSKPERLEFVASDGAVIVMDLYRAAAGPAPIVITFTPYLRSAQNFNSLPVEALNAAGITCIACDIRGTGESQSPFLGPLSPREVQDGAEIIEWLAAQPFCTGKVGTTGISYPGAIQMLIAARRPKGLACIAPTVGPMDFFRDWTHRGGIPTHTNWGALTFLVRNQPKASVRQALEFYYTACQVHAEDSAFFEERSAAYVLDRIEVPTLIIGGLFDYFARASYRCYQQIDAPKRMVFGPWGHQAPDDATELVNWFRYWLNGEGENPTEGDPVKFWRIGADEWIGTPELNEGLRTRLPITDAPVSLPVYGSDSHWPMRDLPLPVDILMDTSTWSGMHLWGETATFDIALDPAAVVQGLPILELSFTSPECTDFDLYARLALVGDNPVQLTEGRLRMSHRAIDDSRTRRDGAGEIVELRLSHKDAKPIENGVLNTVSIEILPTSFVVPAGHRLRLGLSAVRADGRQAHTHIEIDPSSALILPRVDRR